MRFHAVLGVALRQLRKRPVRTFLLLQGTVWGVAVAIGPSAVIAGTREAARTQAATLGADRISVAADPTSARPTSLRVEDLGVVRAALREGGTPARALGGVRLLRTLNANASGETDRVATLLEATPGVEPARGLRLAKGRWLRADDGPGRCVVEAGVAAWLGVERLVPGQRVLLPARGGAVLFDATRSAETRAVEIVGVAAARNAQVLRTNDLGFDLEHAMYKKVGARLLLAMGIPLVSDAWKRSERCIYVPRPKGATASLDWIFVRVEPAVVTQAASRVRAALARRDKAAVTLHPIVLPMILGDQVERYRAVNLAMFLACLLMGAVVMMNFGLLNALSRAREIAIRRTEGATQRDITLQFLIEGFLLAAVGSVLGCFLGMGLAHLRSSLEPVTGFTWIFPWREAAWATAVALVIGLLAAALPARQAARQDPVRGLADE